MHLPCIPNILVILKMSIKIKNSHLLEMEEWDSLLKMLSKEKRSSE